MNRESLNFEEIARGGEYCPPTIEMFDISVERGFGASDEPNWGDGDLDGEAPNDWGDL